MRAAIFNEPRDITAGDRPDAAIREPSDAVVRVVLACVCGSDLWYYRGDSPFEPGPIGHEFIGVIEDIGADVITVRKGDLVISPFAFSDGTCPNCQNGITTACMNGGFYPMNGDGGQGEAVRVPLADTTLVVVPGSGHSDEMMRSLLTLSDVFATGHHAAVCAQARPDRRRRRRWRRRPLRRAGCQAPRSRADHRPLPPRRPPEARARVRRHGHRRRARRGGRRRDQGDDRRRWRRRHA